MVQLLIKTVLVLVIIGSGLSVVALKLGDHFPAHRLIYIATQQRVSDQEVFILHLERRLSMSLTRERVMDRAPVVSPDGAWLMFRTTTAERQPWLVNLNTAGRQRLPELPGKLSMLSVAWLENDQIGVGLIREGLLYNVVYDPYTLDVTEHNEFTFEAQTEGYEYLSPDSQYVVVIRDLGGQRDLYLESAQGGNTLNLTNDDHFESFVVWSPDSRYLAYVLMEHEMLLEFRIMEVSSQKIIYRSDDLLTSAEIAWASVD